MLKSSILLILLLGKTLLHLGFALVFLIPFFILIFALFLLFQFSLLFVESSLFLVLPLNLILFHFNFKILKDFQVIQQFLNLKNQFLNPKC